MLNAFNGYTYISGAITNNPNYKKQFFNAEKHLESQGETVLNPVKLGLMLELRDGDPSWTDYMKLDIAALIQCDAVYMLQGWQSSKGATLEHYLAKELGLKIIYQEGNDEL